MTAKQAPPLSVLSLEDAATTAERLSYNESGLIPAIAQQHDSGEVLMMAWMSKEAIEETLTTGQVCYFSRSRNALWRKGESSGQTQKLIDFRYDCDQDTILVLVDQTGVACHTGRRSCFYFATRDGKEAIISEPEISVAELYGPK